MNLYTFEGAPEEIGRIYGKTFTDAIRKNLSILVWRKGYDPLPRENAAFISWIKTQGSIIQKNWPWLIEEIQAVADGIEVKYEDILFLNLRVWQYDKYAVPADTCSSLAITLGDGTVACAGALDDEIDYYCGPIKVVPEKGYAFITFPIAGTSWGNRGINSAGLALGESSQLLPGLNQLPNAINQDLGLRVILQTCATVGDVREFCKKYPFTINLICVDAGGAVLCAHHTAAGLYELTSETPCALTNHIVDDRVIYELHQKGMRGLSESPTTRFRRGKLLEFAGTNNGLCTGKDVRAFITDHKEDALSSICPIHNVSLTYANPQKEGGILWITQPRLKGNGHWYKLEV